MINLLRPEFQEEENQIDDQNPGVLNNGSNPGVLAYDNSPMNGILRNQFELSPGQDEAINRNDPRLMEDFNRGQMAQQYTAAPGVDPNSFSNENINAIISGDNGFTQMDQYPNQPGLGVMQKDQLAQVDGLGNQIIGDSVANQAMSAPIRQGQGQAKTDDENSWFNKTNIADVMSIVGGAINDASAQRAGRQGTALKNYIANKNNERMLARKLANDRAIANAKARAAAGIANSKSRAAQGTALTEMFKMKNGDKVVTAIEDARKNASKIVNLFDKENVTYTDYNAAVETLQKIIDEGAVVRSDDINRFKESLGALKNLKAKWKQTGGKNINNSDPAVQQLLSTANSIYSAVGDAASKVETKYRNISKSNGLNYNELFKDGFFSYDAPAFDRVGQNNMVTPGNQSQQDIEQRNAIIDRNAQTAFEMY